MKKQILILSILLLFPVYGYAVTVKATVDRNHISIEDTVTLTVTIDDDKPRVDTSSIIDFSVVSQTTGSNFQWINGKTLREFKHTYILAPLKKGRLVIPGLNVTGNGEHYTTEPITVMVSDAKALSGNNSRDLFVKAGVTSETVYPGQQVVYTFSFYHAVQITNASLKSPDFKGFTTKEVEGEKSYRTVINGREYNVIEKYIVLVPSSSGDVTIPPSVLTCDKVVRVNSGRRDPFDSFFNDSFFGRTRLQRKVLRTDPVKISVRPLPDYTLDFPFSGLVGTVDYMAELESWDLNVGDSTTLKITIQGSGNIMDVEEPDIEAPEGFKLYRDSPEEEYATDKSGITGKKVFRFALVAVKPGTHVIPSLKISFFDVSKGKYETLAAGPFEIHVSPSTSERLVDETSQPMDAEKTKRLKKKVEYTGRDILPLKEDLDAVITDRGLSFIYFVVFTGIPFAGLIFLKCILLLSGREKSIATQMIRRAEMALKKASSGSCSDDDFLSNLYKSLVSIVFSKASTSGESLTTSEAVSILSNAGCRQDLIDETVTLLDTLESYRFSGLSMDENRRKTLLANTGLLIKRLRK